MTCDKVPSVKRPLRLVNSAFRVSCRFLSLYIVSKLVCLEIKIFVDNV